MFTKITIKTFLIPLTLIFMGSPSLTSAAPYQWQENRDLVKVARPLTSLMAPSDQEEILLTLGKVDPDKQHSIITAVVPLFQGFREHLFNALCTSYIIKTLGTVSFEEMPLYLQLLDNIVTKPTYAEEASGFLKVLVAQGSVKKAADLVKVARPLTSLVAPSDQKEILLTLGKVDPDNREPLITAVVPLFKKFSECPLNTLCTSYIIKTLGTVSLEDIPRYLQLLDNLVTKPTFAEEASDLLKVLVAQGSVENAEALIKLAQPLTTLVTAEDRRNQKPLQYIAQALAKANQDKRESIIKAIVPLFRGFNDHLFNAICTSHIIKILGTVSLKEMPLYLQLLDNLLPSPTHAEEANDLLKVLVAQGSVEKAEALFQKM